MTEKRKLVYSTEKQTQGQFNVNNALFCATLCQLAYRSQSEIEKELPEYGYYGTDVIFFRTSLAHGFIIEFDNVIAVSFRGSVTRREWANNFKIWTKHTPYGRIHAGFYQTIKQVGPLILPIVLPRLHSGKQLVVTGHSRGGPLAVLFAFMALLNGQDTHAVTTINSPLFCGRKFAWVIQKCQTRMPVFNVINNHDVVSMLPSLNPEAMFLLLMGACGGLWRLISIIPKYIFKRIRR